jgi:hypothetical protein
VIRRAAPALLAGLLLAAPAQARKERVPAWARPHLDAERAEPEAGVHARHLYVEVEWTVHPDGSMTTRGRSVTQVVDEAGIEAVRGGARYDDDSEVVSHGLWVVDARGEVRSADRDEAMHGTAAPGFVLHTDTMVESLPLPSGCVGGFAVHESVVRGKEPLLAGEAFAQREHPVELARFRLAAPAGWRATVRDEYAGEGSGTEVVLRELSAVEELSDSRRVFWRAVPPAGHAARGRSFESWNDVASWWSRLAAGRLDPDESVRNLARELGAGELQGHPYATAVAEWVREEIRYVAVEVGIGGHQPRPAELVLENRYGDCKDMTALTVALLRAGGVRALPALVRTFLLPQVVASEPVAAFNHVIVHLPAQAADGPLSAPLWFDATSPTHGLGDPPYQDEGTVALVVAEDGTGRLEEVPLSPPEENRSEIAIDAMLLPGGDLVGELVAELSGEPALQLRGIARDMDRTDRDRLVRARVREWIPGVRVERMEIDLEREGEVSVRLSCVLHLPGAARPAGQGRLALEPARLLGRPVSSAGKSGERLFYYLREDRVSLRVETPGLVAISLPAPGEISAPFARLALAAAKEQAGFSVTRRATIAEREADLDEVRAFLARVEGLGRTPILLAPAGAPPAP